MDFALVSIGRCYVLTSLILALLHETVVVQHFGKNCIFIDGAVLDATTPIPYNLLLLTETLVEKINLKGKTVSLHIFVEVCQVNIICDGLEVNGQVEDLSQSSGERSFTSTEDRVEGSPTISGCNAPWPVSSSASEARRIMECASPNQAGDANVNIFEPCGDWNPASRKCGRGVDVDVHGE